MLIPLVAIVVFAAVNINAAAATTTVAWAKGDNSTSGSGGTKFAGEQPGSSTIRVYANQPNTSGNILLSTAYIYSNPVTLSGNVQITAVSADVTGSLSATSNTNPNTYKADAVIEGYLAAASSPETPYNGGGVVFFSQSQWNPGTKTYSASHFAGTGLPYTYSSLPSGSYVWVVKAYTEAQPGPSTGDFGSSSGATNKIYNISMTTSP